MTNSNQNNENLPKILCKYLPLKDLTHFYYRNENINTMLTENKIFFPDYRKLNDPKEGNNCNIILNEETIDKQENEHPLIKYLKLKFRILSLTKDCFNESMWDRYAGGYNSLNKTYEGICIGFKTNNEVFNEARKIEYVNEPKVKNITKEFDELKGYFEKDNISYKDEEYENLIKPLKEKIKESFFYKDEYWEKEEEYRIVDERNFFLVDSEKELEFELIKCILRENNLEELIKNISEVETTDSKEEKTICPYKDLKKFYKEFIHDISKDDKNKNSNEVINKIIEEIYKMNEKFKKENYHNIEEIYKMNENSRKKGNKSYNYDFFEYSHKEIACLIAGCDLEKKCLEIFNKYLKQYNNDYEDFINSLIKSENVLEKMHENKKIFKKKINVKLIKESNKIINDMLLKFEENINKKNINEQLKKDINEYLKLIEYIMQTITNENDEENEEYNKSNGIFIAFYQSQQNLLINLIPEVRGIFKFYLFELKFKREFTEIFGEKNVEKIIKYIFEEKIYDKDILKKNYYIFVLEYVYSKIKYFFRNINELKNIENYKNNPEKLEEDIKDFCKNNPEKFKKEIKKLAKDISKIIEFISHAEPKSELSFIYSSYYQRLYDSLNLFFNNKTEKLEELKKQNKEFYENFKNIKFYKTITENGQIQLTNCITGKIIKNQEELEKDIENQEELEKDIKENKKNKEPEVSLVKN